MFNVFRISMQEDSKYSLRNIKAGPIFRSFISIFMVNHEDTFTRCNKYSRPALALGLSKKLDISRSFIAIFMVNHEDTFTRCNKYSSKLDISRSFITIFAD